MADQTAETQPAPVISLEYSNHRSEPWTSVVRFFAWISIIYGASTELAAVAALLMYWTYRLKLGVHFFTVIFIIRSVLSAVA